MNIFNNNSEATKFPIPELNLPNTDYRAYIVKARLSVIGMVGIEDTSDTIYAEYICTKCRKETATILMINSEHGNDRGALTQILENTPNKFLRTHLECNCQNFDNSSLSILRQLIYCRTNPSSNEDSHEYVRYNTQFAKAGNDLVVVDLNQKTIKFIPTVKGMWITSKTQTISKGFDISEDLSKEQHEEYDIFLASDYSMLTSINIKTDEEKEYILAHLMERTQYNTTFMDEALKYQCILSDKIITITNLDNGDTISFVIETN